MSEPAAPAPNVTPVVGEESRFRNGMIFGTLGLGAAIIFGLLYLFVLAPTVPDGSVGWFLFSFATGITMIVMPCTLPLAFVIVPLSMGKGVVKGLGIALSFGVGVAAMLSLYGVAAALLGGLAIDALGADLEGIKNWVYFVAGIFALIFALGGIGLVKFQMPSYTGAAPAIIQKRQDYVKAFLLGLFLGNIGVGCPHPATPLILIEIASSGDILYGWLMFLLHAVGRVIPLLILAFLAILGVNGLNWLVKRKDKIERATGWAMIYVAGFILTLGLFTHDWWVNSGIHTWLEKLTSESAVNALLNETLGTNVAHVHGLEDGTGLFGLPLWLGNWFLVAVWLIPLWWWYARKRAELTNSPAFKIRKLEEKIDELERDRREIEGLVHLDEKEKQFDLAELQQRMDELEGERRRQEASVEYGEEGVLRNPIARTYEIKVLAMKRNFFILLSIFLGLTFIYWLPTDFYKTSKLSEAGVPGFGHHDDHGDDHAHDDGSDMTGMMMRPQGETFSTDPTGLPEVVPTEFAYLSNGASIDITAEIVQKKVGQHTLRMLAYNRMVPGPIINAEAGDRITINFTNLTDVEQTIHHHGIQLENEDDGVPGVTQSAVQPGESFTYDFVVPDPGLFWYHPHTRDDYGQESGLYGNYLIDPIESDYYSEVNREIPLVIDDILITDGAIEPFYKQFTNFALLGRFGNTFLVNGEVDHLIQLDRGSVVRFYVTNVSNARTYNLSIPGAQLKRVAGDLSKFEREDYVDSFLISPAERVIVEAYFPERGLFKLVNTQPTKTETLSYFNVTDNEVAISYLSEFQSARLNTELVQEISTLRDRYLNAPLDKRIRLTVDLGSAMVDHSAHAHGTDASADDGHDHGSMDMSGDVDHSMHAHGAADPNDPLSSIQWNDDTASDVMNTSPPISWKMVDMDTGKEGMMIDDWNFRLNDFVKISFYNDETAAHVMQHPIHFHGQRFIVLSRDGVPETNAAWKDTEMVLPGQTIEILVEMNNSGEWMTHCHISEHLHAGMMLAFRVEDENGYARGDEVRATLPQTSHSRPAADLPTGEMVSMQTQNVADQTLKAIDYTFDTQIDNNSDRADLTQTIFQEKREHELQFSLRTASGIPIRLAPYDQNSLRVTFVKSDNSHRYVTYPGAVLDIPLETAGDDHGHDDGHDHEHSFNFIQTAYAHGGVDDGHPGGGLATDNPIIHTVPAYFTTRGSYRAFVEYVPEGTDTVLVTTFDVEVSAAGFNINNFGWSAGFKWNVLLLISILLMLILSNFVYKYVSKV